MNSILVTQGRAMMANWHSPVLNSIEIGYISLLGFPVIPPCMETQGVITEYQELAPHPGVFAVPVEG